MKREIGTILTNGLLQGYAGREVGDVERAGIKGKVSHISFPEGFYHDEWFVPGYLGGGQELIQAGDEQFTRLYAGGTPDPKLLEALGVHSKDVGGYLKKKITELGDKTRLFEDCKPESDEEWQYAYKITSANTEIPVTTSLESITYKGSLVHIHVFILCPLK